MVKIVALLLGMHLTSVVYAQTDCIPEYDNYQFYPIFNSNGIRYEDGRYNFATTNENSLSNGISKRTNSILSESFEYSVNPMGWAASNFTKSSAYFESLAPNNTGHFAVFNATSVVGTIGTMVTPRLAPVSGNNKLTYKVNYIVYNSTWAAKGAAMYIEFSEDAGKTWTTSTINELGFLPNYNSSTTGWATNTVDLSAYEGKEVMLRFRCEADYGQGLIGIDDVAGPEAVYYINDISGKFYLASMKNIGFCHIVPSPQLDTVYFYAHVKNDGLAVQSNVALHADINNGDYIASKGLRNPRASVASGSIDTMSVAFKPYANSYNLYEARLWVTQTQTDGVPENNKLDSVWFLTTNNLFMRTIRASVAVSSYYYAQTSVPTISGFEYGSSYTLKTTDYIDSIQVAIVKSVGSGSIVGKLYTVTGTTTLTYTKVAETVPFYPPVGNASDWTKLKFTSQYRAFSGAKLAAMIQLNITPGKDTIWIGMDDQFIGSTASGSLAYMNVKQSGGAAALGWYTLPYQPLVGLIMHYPYVSVIGTKSELKNVSIYPNPANDHVNLSNIGKDARVIMLNAMGQVVYATTASDNLTISTAEMKDGIYYIRVNENAFKVVIAK